MRGTIPSWKGEAGVGLALAAAGGATIALAWHLPRGDLSQPGAGAFPLALGLMLIGLGLLCALDARRRQSDAPVDLAERRSLACGAALLLAAFAFVPLGFALTGFLFMTLLFRVLAEISWLRALLAGALAAAAAWIFFVVALGVQLPAGVLPL